VYIDIHVKKIFIPILFFLQISSYDFVIMPAVHLISRIAASSTVIKDVTNQVMHRTFNTNL